MKKIMFCLFVLVFAMACNPLALLDSIIAATDNAVDSTCTSGCYNVLDGGPKATPRPTARVIVDGIVTVAVSPDTSSESPVKGEGISTNTNTDYRSEACHTFPLFAHQKESDVTESFDGVYCGPRSGYGRLQTVTATVRNARGGSEIVAVVVPVTDDNTCPSDCAPAVKVRDGDYVAPPTNDNGPVKTDDGTPSEYCPPNDKPIKQ